MTFFFWHYNFWGKLFGKNSLILDNVEVKSYSPSLPTLFPFPSLALPTFHRFTTFPFPFNPTFLLTSLLLPFPVPSVVPYIALSLSTFLIPSQPTPFPLNLSLFLSTFPVATYPYPFLLTPTLLIHFHKFPRPTSLPTRPTLLFFPLLPFPFSFSFFFPFFFHLSFPSPPLGTLIYFRLGGRGNKFYTTLRPFLP